MKRLARCWKASQLHCCSTVPSHRPAPSTHAPQALADPWIKAGGSAAANELEVVTRMAKYSAFNAFKQEALMVGAAHEDVI